MFDSQVKGTFPKVVEKVDKYLCRDITAEELMEEFRLPIVMDVPIKLDVKNEVTRKGKVVRKITIAADDIPTEFIGQLKDLGFQCKQLVFKEESEQEKV